MLLLIIMPATISAFFFPSSGGGGCSCGCAPPPICPPVASCAIPGPCPEYTATDWTSGVPAAALPAIPAQPLYDSAPSYQVAEVAIPACTAMITTGCSSAVALPVAPAVAVPAAPYYPPASGYVGSYSGSYVNQGYVGPAAAVAPPAEYQEDRIIEVVGQPTFSPTLIPPVIEQPVASSSYAGVSSGYSGASSSYDSAPPPLPPVPPVTMPVILATAPPVVEYKTSETIIPTVEYTSNPYSPKEQYEENTGINSGETAGYSKLNRKVSTEGYMEPMNAIHRRNLILKRMRNVRTMVTPIPHTNATCNSNKLANIMARAIVPDVSVAKRMVMRSAELAFDGAKFDVFCATGEFSYSIHSRKYCEVTRDEVTCFAFR